MNVNESRIKPSARSKPPPMANKKKIVVMPIRIGTSRLINLRTTLRGTITALIPSIKAILARLLPRMLPSAIPGLSLAASKEVAISGIDVAIETTVKPTTIGAILRLTEIAAAPLVKKSPP